MNAATRALTVCLVLLAGCTGGSEPAASEAPRGATRVIVGLATEITSEGLRALRVEADSGFAGVGSGVVLLVGVEARALDETGRTRMTLRADSGHLDEAARTFTALGDVRARTSDGSVVLETTDLTFDPATGRFRTDSAAVVEAEGGTQRGTCFEGDPMLTEWRFCEQGGGG